MVPQPGGHANIAPSPSPSPFQPISPAPRHGSDQKLTQDVVAIERRASLEEMLAEVEKSANNAPNVLQPKVMTPGEIEEQKLEAQAEEDIAKATAKGKLFLNVKFT